MSRKVSNMSFSGNETYWLNLVKDIYRNRDNCPHRQTLKQVLKDASHLYCAVDPEDKKLSSIDKLHITRSSNYGTRSFRSNGTPSSASGFTGNESGWLHLVKNILRNSNCKFHGKLKLVLKKASKVYCKPKAHGSRKTRGTRKSQKKTTSSPSIFKTLGLV